MGYRGYKNIICSYMIKFNIGSKNHDEPSSLESVHSFLNYENSRRTEFSSEKLNKDRAKGEPKDE